MVLRFMKLTQATIRINSAMPEKMTTRLRFAGVPSSRRWT